MLLLSFALFCIHRSITLFACCVLVNICCVHERKVVMSLEKKLEIYMRIEARVGSSTTWPMLGINASTVALFTLRRRMFRHVCSTLRPLARKAMEYVWNPLLMCMELVLVTWIQEIIRSTSCSVCSSSRRPCMFYSPSSLKKLLVMSWTFL